MIQKQTVVFKKPPRKRTAVCEEYKKLFQVVKCKSKKNCYPNLLLKYKENIKTWQILKGIIGKLRLPKSSLPLKTIIFKKNYKKRIFMIKEQ